jgi:hypothetical protein
MTPLIQSPKPKDENFMMPMNQASPNRFTEKAFFESPHIEHHGPKQLSTQQTENSPKAKNPQFLQKHPYLD